MQRVQTLYGYAEPNFAGVNYATMTADFVAGKFAMMPDGTWNTTTLQKARGNKPRLRLRPDALERHGERQRLAGRRGRAVPGDPGQREEPRRGGGAWMDFFTKHYALFDDQAGFAPAVQGAQSNAFYSSVEKYTTQFEPTWDTIWIANTKAGPNASVPFNWAGISPMGGADAAGAAQAAQKDWSAGLSK